MRKLLLTLTLLLAGLAGPVFSGTLADAVVAELDAKGYSEVRVVRSWLGRIIITAELDGRVREITINPKTDEILRDFFRSPEIVHDSDDTTTVESTTETKDRNVLSPSSVGGTRTTGNGGVESAGGILLDSVEAEGGE